MSIDPIKATEVIRRSYLDYLQTLYSIQDAELKGEFARALRTPNLLVRSAIIEAAPMFETTASLQDLAQAGVVTDEFRNLHSGQMPSERPLYRHQADAVRKAVSGRNVVVASGTGSGKTEAFLIPILNHLMVEKAAGTLADPGVRALLIYPMNALANDQLKRLRHLLADYPDITFGRYTGETANDYEEARTRFRLNYPDEPVIPNELQSREEMQANPPHLLITNYAMLEYLLLRPRDAEFFDGSKASKWRFLVLDEAHVYDGAQAMEIAMLLRRLKERVVAGEVGRLQCFATSATLGGGEGDFREVAEFAAGLFGETFEYEEQDTSKQDVVGATTVSPASYPRTWGELPPSAFEALHGLVLGKDTEAARSAIANLEAPEIVKKGAIEAIDQGNYAEGLFEILKGEEHLRRLRELLFTGPQELDEVANELFPSSDGPTKDLVALIDLAVAAKSGDDSETLLPARYHVFARALEGAFVCLNSDGHQPDESGTRPPRLFLRRYEICPHCGSRVFELATCTRCGQAYLVGYEQEEVAGQGTSGEQAHQPTGRLVHATTLGYQTEQHAVEYFVLSATPTAAEDEDEFVVTSTEIPEADTSILEKYGLCVRTGFVSPGGKDSLPCNCGGNLHLEVYRAHKHKGNKYQSCASCGASGSGSIYRFLSGQDAPVSVLATSLYQSLPPSDHPDMLALPGEGRKLLIFTDSRQNAAFFAPYLERTYSRALRRRLILLALQETTQAGGHAFRVQDLVPRLVETAESLHIFGQEQSYIERTKTCATWLMLELIPLDRRISLSGLGLLRLNLPKPMGWQPPRPLLEAPWNLSVDESWDLICVLLDTLRWKGTTTFPDGVDPREQPAFAPRQRAFFVRKEDPDAKNGVFSWLPKKGSNSRLDFLVRLLTLRSSLPESEVHRVAKETLEGLWKHMTQDKAWKDHLLAETDRRLGTIHRINHRMWEIQPATNGDLSGQFVCSRCGNVSTINLDGCCPTYRCSGQLLPMGSDNRYVWDNHYRKLYTQLAPIPLTAQEHTAQWTAREAARVQDEFIRGEVNALSCSTTFELGVDVGDLETVLLRNMPPRTANYVQRAGRAGRRLDSAAFVLTFAQRRSHDLTFYSKPKEMVSGKIRPPSVSLTNEKIIRRHLHSVAFSHFFREHYRQTEREYRYLSAYFESPEEGEAPGIEHLRVHLAKRPEALKTSLSRVIPQEMQASLGIDSWKWVPELTNPATTGILDRAEAEVLGDLETLHSLELEAVAKSDYRRAESYKRVQTNVRRRRLLDLLGTRNVLPKYGFPVDVVELRTNHLDHIPEAGAVELSRDLKMAISEYAPGSQVVAGKRVWESGGIRQLPNRELDTFRYAVCPSCNRFHYVYSDDASSLPSSCECGQDLTRRSMGGTFIIPEHGFVASRNVSTPGENRPQRTYATRVFFADYERDRQRGEGAPDLELDESLSSPQLQVYKGHSRFGWLAVVNPGINNRGFRMCRTCGFAEAVPLKPSRASSHTNPITGKKCSGTLSTAHLGHRFMSDVLQVKFDGLLASSAPPNLWISLLYGLLEGSSEALGIRRDDIDGTLFPQGKGSPPSVILFDSVPGGAGHVQRVGQSLDRVFMKALERVARCECGPETSCYECLRNYYNEYFHPNLSRGIVVDFLSGAMNV